MKPEWIDPHELRFSETNARNHGERSVRAVMKSLQEFGQQKPIVVSPENEVIAGHGTLAAAMRLKLPRVWIVRSAGAPMAKLGPEFTEACADDVEWRHCKECGHRWPK